MLPDVDQSLKKPSKIALAALGILLILAVVLYKERLFFADTVFLTFNIIDYVDLQLVHERYGAFITHGVPFIGAMLDLPIRLLLILSAASYNLFYAAVGAVLVFGLRQYRLAILLSLYYFLIVSDSFFLPCGEIHQAVAWMFLWLSVTLFLGSKQVNVLWLLIPFTLLAFVTLSTHFIVIIPTVFLWVYLIIEKDHWPFSKSTTILLSGIICAIAATKFLIKSPDAYDDKHLYGVLHFSIKDIIMTFSSPVVKMFFYRCVVNYWIASILFIAGLANLFRSRKFLPAAWTLISFIGYLILMGLSYGDLDKNVLLFHIETEWESLGIIVATPFVFSYLPKLKTSSAVGFLIIIFVTRLAYIGSAVPMFSWRTHFKNEVLAQMKKKGITKLALYTDRDLQVKNVQDWAMPYETILASASNGDKPNLTFFLINKDDKHTMDIIKDPKGFYDAFDMLPPKNLNSRYFSIDTTQPYQVMSYGELFN